MATVLLDSADMRRTLGRMAHEILESNQGVDDLVVLGVVRRGWPIAKRLGFLMTQIEGVTVPVGRLDISAYRDDRKALSGEDETEVPFGVEGKRVVLVDEVMYTGRTVRAAINAVMALGRPAKVELAVLIDRGHRELPIEPNYRGRTIETDRGDYVEVREQEYDGEDAVLLVKGSERSQPR